MTDTTTQDVRTIDATGKRLGRVATEVAALLMGKHRTDATRHILTSISVEVVHASKLLLDERKRLQKTYQRYSGYPGGLSSQTLEKMIEQKGYGAVLRKAVYGMLPNNRLRAPRMKNLSISE
jgi:large subunit ribosomal protein L13